ncbi:MAG: ATP-binding cassette domain-containing protein, partial [Acholeplasmataceae bacterium]|nr:ATP-binding cassette domain-containing protein [Acholeplasmataceae bacterium]
LLSMALDDYTGKILVDGTDMKTIMSKSFNEKVSYVYQDVFLFEATLKENIALFKETSDQAIHHAINQAGLSEFVNQLPDGIHTQISENGKNLSGGERQRVSIARALFKQADILFVDEATSSLNDELGVQIEQTLLSLDATILAISHKAFPGVTKTYDFVLELKDGYVTTYAAEDYFAEVTQ